MRTVGVISDTHGLVRAEVLDVFRNVDLIVHGGDIGGPEVLQTLESLAPIRAVRGNNDKGTWARRLPETEVVEVGEVRIYVLHDLNELDLSPFAAGFHAVVSGHSHRPSIERRDGILFLNPGSAGPRRFKLPVSLARLTVRGTDMEAELIELSL